jgi:hypothetical protein
MRTLISVCTIALFSLLFFGCLDVEQRYTLNPDGSGKVAVDARMIEWGLDENDENFRNDLRQKIKGYLEGAEGVDAWRDVTYSFEESKIHFKGTAYFPDLAKLKSSDFSLGNIAMESLAGGDKAVTLDMNTNSEASMTSSSDGEDNTATLTPEEIQHQIDSLKENWETMKGMMGMVLNEMVIKTSVNLPGAPHDVSGFTSNGSTIAYEFHGEAMLNAMDTLMTNPEMLRQQVESKSDDDMKARMQSLIFPNGEPRALFSGNAQPSFNYKAESAAAKKEHAKIMKGLSAPEPRNNAKKGKRT